MLIENPSKGKLAMIAGVIIGVIGLFSTTGPLIVIGIGLFVIGKFLNWFHN